MKAFDQYIETLTSTRKKIFRECEHSRALWLHETGACTGSTYRSGCKDCYAYVNYLRLGENNVIREPKEPSKE